MRRFFIFILLCLLMPGIANAISRHDFNLDKYMSGVEKFKKTGDHNGALKDLLSFITVAEDPKTESKYDKELMASYCYVGTIYGSYEDYVKARGNFEKGLALSEKLNEYEFRAAFINNLTNCLIKTGRYDEAERMISRLLKLPRQTAHLRYEYSMAMGNIRRDKGDVASAARLFREAASLARQERQREYKLACVTGEIASCYERSGEVDSQEYYLLRSFDYASRQAMPMPKISAARELMRLYARTRRLDSVVNWQERYFTLTDSLMPNREFSDVRATHEDDTLKSKGLEIAGLNSTITLQWILLTFFIVACGVVSVMLWIIIRQKRNIETAHRVLFDKDRRDMELEPQDTATPAAVDCEKEKTTSKDTEESAADRELYDRIRQEMENSREYLNPDFGLAQLTALVRSNTSYVSKVIGRYSGGNVKTFINEYRVREAKRRMLNRDTYGMLTIQAIAESVGFGSQASFNRIFKRHAGMTPSEYMAMAGESTEAIKTAKMQND